MSDDGFIDTNIWFYAFTQSNSAEEQAKRQQAIERIHSDIKISLSIQVINELSFNLIRKASFQETALKSLIQSFYQTYRVIGLTESVLIAATDLRQRYSLSFWDGLIVSAALESGCKMLYSKDMQHNQNIDDRLTIINPFKA